MKKMLTSLIVFLSLTSAHAQTAASKPVKLGVLNDQSGQYADAAGPAAVEVARMAIADFGGKLLGQPIELTFADHQNKADIASGIARRWIDTENVDVILDIGNSAVALALSDLVRDKNKIMIVSSAGASTITNERCSPNTFQWTYNTNTLARSTAKALMGQGGNEWFFLTADYAFGHAFEADASAVIKASGGKVVGCGTPPLQHQRLLVISAAGPELRRQCAGARQCQRRYLQLAHAGPRVRLARPEEQDEGGGAAVPDHGCQIGRSSPICRACSRRRRSTGTETTHRARSGSDSSTRSDACRPWFRLECTPRPCTI